jgi:hypothetical protein
MKTGEIRDFLKKAKGKKVQIIIKEIHYNPRSVLWQKFTKGQKLIGRINEFDPIKDYAVIASEDAGSNWLDAGLYVFEIDDISYRK